jgi:Phasin protein
MSNRYHTRTTRDESSENGVHAFYTPAGLAFSMWEPILTATLKGNAQAQEGFGAIATEWQGFVGQRLQEQIALVQRLTHCRTPDQMLAAYGDFWRAAAKDYRDQVTSIRNLMTDLTSKVAVTQHPASEGARTNPLQAEKAA